jgi:hypothetical protein
VWQDFGTKNYETFSPCDHTSEWKKKKTQEKEKEKEKRYDIDEIK